MFRRRIFVYNVLPGLFLALKGRIGMEGRGAHPKLTGRQRQIMFGIVAAYTAAYLNRLNLSAALGGVMRALNLSAAQAGLLQTAFAAVYAIGQFVNGAIADRLSPVRHMLLGLLGTALCNLLMGFSSSYGLLTALCMANGAFQSMLWAPVVRLIALCFDTDEGRSKANFIFSFTMVAGHFGAWAISGCMVGSVGWRMSFIMPALLTLPVLAFAWAAFKAVRSVGAAREAQGNINPKRQPSRSALRLFARTGLFPILLSCVLFGFVRDGIVTWAPEILCRMMADSALSSTAFSLIIPLINLLGILAGFRLKGMRGGNTRRIIGWMLLASGAFCLPLPLARGALSAALLMGASCACLYGLNALLTGLVPLEYDRAGRTGLAAGLIDSLIYAGSALAGVLDGGIIETSGLPALNVTWAASALVGAAAMIWAGQARFAPSKGITGSAS